MGNGVDMEQEGGMGNGVDMEQESWWEWGGYGTGGLVGMGLGT